MNTNMPLSIRTKIQKMARESGWTVEEKSPGVDQYVKLLTLNNSRNGRRVFIDKVIGFSAGGDLRYFKVALNPDHYNPSLEASAGVSAAINLKSKKNLHSHSGYAGCPVIRPHNEPCAKAYKVRDEGALEELLIALGDLKSGV